MAFAQLGDIRSLIPDRVHEMALTATVTHSVHERKMIKLPSMENVSLDARQQQPFNNGNTREVTDVISLSGQ